MVQIETIIALAMVYALLSVVASAVKELLESAVQKRKRDMRGAISDLLGPLGARALLDTPLIQAINGDGGSGNVMARLIGRLSGGVASLAPGWVGSVWAWLTGESGHRQWPSYIQARTFAQAVQGLLAGTGVEAAVKDEIDRSPLARVIASAQADVNQQLELIQNLYEQRMERLIGSFKRNAQWWLLAIGLVLAAVTDADTLVMARRLTDDPAARAVLVRMAQDTQDAQGVTRLCATSRPATAAGTPSVADLMSCLQDATPSVLGLSEQRKQEVWGIGCTRDGRAACGSGLWFALLGYLLTAISISLGAPFWFDLISKVANIRSTLKPKPKPET